MLVGLSEDLFAAGWDQPCKLWMVVGEDGDEFFEYVGSYLMEPAHWMMHRAEEGKLKDTVRGVATCYESWTYPPELNDRLDDNQVSMAYKMLVPPDEHPDHGQKRTVVMVTRDGAVMRADRLSYEDESDAAVMEGAEPTGLTGDRLVDYMRVMLGIAEMNANPLAGLAIVMGHGSEMKSIMQQAQEENWTHAQVAAAIYRSAPPEIQAQLAETMPDDVREELGDDAPEQGTNADDPGSEAQRPE